MPRNPRARTATFFLALLAFSSALAAQTSADLSVTKVDDPDPVAAGSPLVYTITVSNKGPDSADSSTLSDPLPAGTTFQSLAAPAGWSCATPAVGAGGIVSCSNPSFAAGSDVFTLTVGVDAGTVNGTVLANTVTVASASADPNPGSETAEADTTVVASTATVALTKGDSPDPVLAGANLTYTLTASNNGGAELETATVDDTLPAGTAFVSLSSPAGWTCATPAAGGTGAVSCAAAPFVPGDAVFTLVVQIDPQVPGGTDLVNQALLTVTDGGRKTVQSTAATTRVLSPALVTGTKEVADGSRLPGSAVTYTLVLTNSGSNTQGDNPGDELTDVLPEGLTLVSATATSGLATATVATNTVTWNGSIPAGGSVTITINATIDFGVAPDTTLSNQGAIAYDADGDGTNDASGLTDDPAVGGNDDPTSFQVEGGPAAAPVPALGEVGLMLLALLLAMGGAMMLRRRRA